MSADLLRRAASLMRERAERAEQPTGGDRWIIDRHDRYALPHEVYTGPLSAKSGDVAAAANAATAEHIASWHPAVALAVADWLDVTAQCMEKGCDLHGTNAPLNVAARYLGESA